MVRQVILSRWPWPRVSLTSTCSREPHQGGYFDEIAIDPINLQPGDEETIATRLREELTKR